jgi:putative ABC transport system ATP-binding protein
VIHARDLEFAWPGQPPCLQIDALDIDAGAHVFVHGPSGCGKSTLLGLLAGVLLPRSGTLTVHGQDWARLPASARDARRADDLGVIFQQFNLLPYLSVRDNVVLPCRFSDVRRRRATQQARDGRPDTAAADLLLQLGLPADAHDRPAGTLSVGQQQRVAAARALLGQPSLVIADEPTSALDAALRDSFLALLAGPLRQWGATLVFVSHDERLATRFDRVLSLPDLNRATQRAAAA